MTKKEDEILIGALVRDGLLRKEDLARFDGISEDSLDKNGITKTLSSLLRINEGKIAALIAKEFNIPYMPSTDGQKWIEVPNLPKEYLPKYRVVPIFMERKELTIAFIEIGRASCRERV